MRGADAGGERERADSELWLHMVGAMDIEAMYDLHLARPERVREIYRWCAVCGVTCMWRWWTATHACRVRRTSSRFL